jgi:hypothetical protein
LGLKAPKLLLLADTDRLDSQLTVAQMQARAAAPCGYDTLYLRHYAS